MNAVFSKKILVINASYKLRSEIRVQLEASGFNDIDESGDGLEAIRMLSVVTYDLVVTDIDIQNLDGWRLARLIRSDMLKSGGETKIAILSSTYSDRIAEATAKEFEINRFIPIDKLSDVGNMARQLLEDEQNQIPKSRILVIEDYQDTADLINRILHKRFDLTFAADGEQGLDIWRNGHFDIVLLDLMLPKISGEQLLHEILKDKPEQSVIMMTAHGDSKKAGELVLAGAVDFIAKPFKAEQLRHVCGIAAHREDFVISNEQFKEKQLALAAEKNRAQITLKSIADGVITTNEMGLVDYANPVAQKTLKYQAEEMLGRPLSDFYATYHETSHIPTANLVMRAISENDTQRSASRTVLKNRDNEERLVEQQATPIRNKMGVAIGAVLIFRDKTEIKNIEKRLSFHASHDPLTGLHNRDIFDQEIRLALHEAENNGTEHCLCHLSLSQFNIINETYGHRIGDKLLQKVARLLQKKVRAPSDVIARIGGDEFGILLRHCSIEAAERICEVIVTELGESKFEHNDKSFEINAGIGIVSMAGESPELSDVVSAAIAACNMAKERGKNKVATFSKEDIEVLEKRSEARYATALMDAIEAGRIHLFQQKIDNGDNNKVSYEILSRISDESGEIVLPGLYLSAAERYNLTPNLDRWVIKHTLLWLQQHAELAEELEYMSINISGLSICEDSFTDFIKQCFQDTGVNPRKICFEITETAAVSNFIRAGDFITAIRDLGCKFALDDFGSGMSSFAYLKKLPVDILKIDGLFIKDILNDPIDLAMVKSINEVGHVMGLKTVAEYVENEEILKVLCKLGVDSFQGYQIAKPEPLDNLLDHYQDQKAS